MVLTRREDILEYEIRANSSICRFKPIGRDRFCNRYWWFDAGLGCVSLNAITKIPNPTPQETPDPIIEFNYATGRLFVEEMCPDGSETEGLPSELFDPHSDLRIGTLDGSWGYYTDPEQV